MRSRMSITSPPCGQRCAAAHETGWLSIVPTDKRRDLVGGLISFGIEALIVIFLGLLAALLAWAAIALVG